MPQRIPKPCRVRSCSNRTVLPHGYCEQHQDQQFVRTAHKSNWFDWQQKHGNITQRGYGRDWQKLRLLVLSRDDYLCQACRRLGRLTMASTVDHIVPKAQGGDDAMSNLQSLCRPCHQAKTVTESSQ